MEVGGPRAVLLGASRYAQEVGVACNRMIMGYSVHREKWTRLQSSGLPPRGRYKRAAQAYVAVELPRSRRDGAHSRLWETDACDEGIIKGRRV